MANTGRIAGKDLYVSFNGTVISGDQTSVSWSEEGDMADVTAAADAFHYYVYMRKDGTLDFEAFFDASSTTAYAACAVGSEGTLIVGPAGTASGKPKYTWTRAVVASRGMAIPFDDGVTWPCTFQFSSAVSEGAY